MWYDAVNVEDKLEDVYDALIMFTDGEEDKERKAYNDYLIDSVREGINYIQTLERQIRKTRKEKRKYGTHTNTIPCTKKNN